MNIIPIDNAPRYDTSVDIDGAYITFSFRWNRKTKCYFVLATDAESNVYIPNKAIYGNGAIEFSRNSKKIQGALYLISNQEGFTPPLENWADNYILATSTIRLE